VTACFVRLLDSREMSRLYQVYIRVFSDGFISSSLIVKVAVEGGFLQKEIFVVQLFW
jgi:hypothetical protein